MNPDSLSELLIAAGGTGAVVAGLVSWLGYIWSRRILQNEKAAQTGGLERLKFSLRLDQEKQRSEIQYLRGKAQRFSDKQFDLITELWVTLQDVRDIADSLWRKVDSESLIKFVSSLHEAESRLNRAAIFLDDTHFLELQKTILAFQDFRMGKLRLLEIRSMEDFQMALETDRVNFNDDTKLRIEQTIDANRQLKESYEGQLRRLRTSLASQLESD